MQKRKLDIIIPIEICFGNLAVVDDANTIIKTCMTAADVIVSDRRPPQAGTAPCDKCWNADPVPDLNYPAEAFAQVMIREIVPCNNQR
mmetsp:Transcript_8654/g.15338  ORF Transcript_8654/g.15338 Transcript_8654/m.15338 type:complete len:88 (-) Transcript_8654:124-387(-)